MKASDLFYLPPSLATFSAFFTPDASPWTWVSQIAVAFSHMDWGVIPLSEKIPAGLSIQGPVFIHPTVKLPPFGSITGPVWIGAQK